MKILTPHEEWIGKEVVDIAFQIHKSLGPGLLEKVPTSYLKEKYRF